MNQEDQNSNTSTKIDYFQVIINRWGIILLTFLLIFIATWAVVSLMPRKYTSITELNINPDGIEVNPDGSRNAEIFRSEPNFFPTQFKIITSELTLEIVEKKLNLSEKWSMSDTAVVNLLQSMVSAENTKGTSIITISARHRDKQEAKLIVQAVADAYKTKREGSYADKGDELIGNLRDEMESLEADKEEKWEILQDISRETNIQYNPNSAASIDTTLQEQRYGTLQTELKEIKDIVRARSREIETINKKDKNAAIDYIITLTNMGTRLSQLKSVREEIKQIENSRQATLASGVGPKHPDMKIFATRLSERRSELNSQYLVAIDLLNEDHANLKIRYKEIEGDTELARQEFKKRASEYTKFNTARADYLQSKARFDIKEEDIRRFKSTRKYTTEPIEIITKATEPGAPSSPKVNVLLGLGAFVGLVSGFSIALLMEVMDTSIKTLDDVERYLQIPVLAVIPQGVGLLHKEKGASPDAEAYRILRTNIEFNRRGNNDNAITVVSGGAGEGKSTTMINLAYICAQGGYSTLMIDGDLRRPRLHTYFELDNQIGLTNYLTTECLLEDVVIETHTDNLYFMPSGILPADAAGMLNSKRMSHLIQEVKGRFDLVFVDSPPILGVSDASVISSEVDHTMIVVQHRKLPRKMLMRVKQAVINVGGNIIGVVLNNVDVKSDSEYQYYTSYYTYYSPQEVAKSQAAAEKAAAAKIEQSPATQQPAATAPKDDLY